MLGFVGFCSYFHWRCFFLHQRCSCSCDCCGGGGGSGLVAVSATTSTATHITRNGSTTIAVTTDSCHPVILRFPALCLHRCSAVFAGAQSTRFETSRASGDTCPRYGTSKILHTRLLSPEPQAPKFHSPKRLRRHPPTLNTKALNLA